MWGKFHLQLSISNAGTSKYQIQQLCSLKKKFVFRILSTFQQFRSVLELKVRSKIFFVFNHKLSKTKNILDLTISTKTDRNCWKIDKMRKK